MSVNSLNNHSRWDAGRPVPECVPETGLKHLMTVEDCTLAENLPRVLRLVAREPHAEQRSDMYRQLLDPHEGDAVPISTWKIMLTAIRDDSDTSVQYAAWRHLQYSQGFERALSDPDLLAFALDLVLDRPEQDGAEASLARVLSSNRRVMERLRSQRHLPALCELVRAMPDHEKSQYLLSMVADAALVSSLMEQGQLAALFRAVNGQPFFLGLFLSRRTFSLIRLRRRN